MGSFAWNFVAFNIHLFPNLVTLSPSFTNVSITLSLTHTQSSISTIHVFQPFSSQLYLTYHPFFCFVLSFSTLFFQTFNLGYEAFLILCINGFATASLIRLALASSCKTSQRALKSFMNKSEGFEPKTNCREPTEELFRYTYLLETVYNTLICLLTIDRFDTLCWNLSHL